MTQENPAQKPAGEATPVVVPPTTETKTEPTVEERLKTMEARVQTAEQVATEMKGALQEEREKRKTAQQQLEELTARTTTPKPADPAKPDLSEFDEEEIENFKKVSKALDVVFKSDLEAQEALQKQKSQESENVGQYNTFLQANEALFGKEGSATPEQEANWANFSKYVNEVFDINKETLAKTPNLGRKLSAALSALTGSGNTEAAKAAGANEAAAKIQNASMLSVGGGGSGSGPSAGGEWTRTTPEATVRANLARAGYTSEQIDEMIAREKAKK